MTGWMQNIIPYFEKGEKGVCPFCGSNDVTVEEFSKPFHRSITFRCNSCGKTDHFDGVTG